MPKKSLFLLFALGILAPRAALAAPFDLIYVDQISVQAPLSYWRISLGSLGFGILVNTRSSNIEEAELDAADFDVDGVPEWPDTTSARINPWLLPRIITFWPVGPILPDEAVGSVPSEPSVLTPLLAPGETFRNLNARFLYFDVEGIGAAPGQFRFDVRFVMGGEMVAFPVYLTLSESQTITMTFDHASRVSSVPTVTPVRVESWGRLKQLYR